MAGIAGPDPVFSLTGVPDLLGLSLEEMRTLEHPVLSALLVELRERIGRPAETLWGFIQTQSPPPPRPPVRSEHF